MKRWTVVDVMTRDVAWVPENATYHEVIGKIAANDVSAVPVLDSTRRVLGVVSEADLLRKIELGADDRTFLRPSKRAAKAKSIADQAKDLMTTPAVTITPDATLAEAAKILAAQRVKRMPVVDSDGRLIGIVSRADLLKGFLRDDEEIRKDVVNEVLRDTLWIEPHGLVVTVVKGSVRLRGEVDRKSTAQLVTYLCGTIPGVVEIHDQLSWHYDDTHESTGYYRSHPFNAEAR